MQTVELTVPSSFAFDYLSVLQLKHYKSKNEQAQDNFDRCYLELKEKFGDLLMKDVFWSNEYQELFKANEKIFDLVDELKRNPHMPGSVIDNLNLLRAQIKKKIQEKYFGGGALEQKFGYKEEIK